MVGVVNTLIDFGILNSLVLWFGVSGGWGLLLCNGVSFTAASLNSYLMNRKWTFGEEGEASPGQYLFFLSFALGGLLVNTCVLYLLTRVVLNGETLHPILMVNLAKVCATLAGMTWNFLAFRFIVFHREPKSLPSGRRYSGGKI
jgi:putative flippase GtrA